jgi:hypothetical protein
MDNLYLAIINLIKTLFPVDYASYTNTDNNSITPIFRGYDNKLVPPITNNYVILTTLSDKNMSLGIEPNFNTTTKANTYTGIMSTLFHIDMYGNNAENNCRILNTLCQNGYANMYWNMNNYACSVHKVKTIEDFTDIFGRDMYNKRYLLKLEVFNNVVNTITIPDFNVVDFNLYLANSQQ